MSDTGEANEAIELPPFLFDLVEYGIEPYFETIRSPRDGESKKVLNLDSKTKSGMFLLLNPDEDGAYVVEGRYAHERDEVESLLDLAGVFARRYEAREFGSDAWLSLAVDQGVMKTQTQVTYKVAR